MAALVACSNEGRTSPSPDAGPASDRPVARCSVRFDGDPAILVRTSERRRLRIVLDPPTPGVGLRVGVVGVGLDASLTDTRMITGEDGSAQTELIAPTDSATFRVRATAECGALSLLLLADLARAHAPRAWPLAALAVAADPTFLWETTIAYSDLSLLLFGTATLEALLAARASTDRDRWTAPVRRELLSAGSTASFITREVSRAVAEAGGATDGGSSPFQLVFEAALRSGLGARFDAELTSRGLRLENSFDQIAATTARALVEQVVTGKWQDRFSVNVEEARALATRLAAP